LRSLPRIITIASAGRSSATITRTTHGRVGEVEFGHDFAITEDAFWLTLGFSTTTQNPVLDLTEPAGQAEAADDTPRGELEAAAVAGSAGGGE